MARATSPSGGSSTHLSNAYGHRGRNGNYSQRELAEWADRIRRWRRTVDVYAYFNNDWNGYAVRNGRLLRATLGV